VILRVETGASTYWLDATRSHQRGPLQQIYTSDFGEAFGRGAGHHGIDGVSRHRPRRCRGERSSRNYKVQAPGKDTQLDVVSEFHGVPAESMRSYFQNTLARERHPERVPAVLRAALSEDPGDEVRRFEEMPGDAGCLVKEHYNIPEMWELNEEKSATSSRSIRANLEQDMGTPGSTQRNDPLALKHPINITQEIHAEMFQKWSFQPSKKRSPTHSFATRRNRKRRTVMWC